MMDVLQPQACRIINDMWFEFDEQKIRYKASEVVSESEQEGKTVIMLNSGQCFYFDMPLDDYIEEVNNQYIKILRQLVRVAKNRGYETKEG